MLDQKKIFPIIIIVLGVSILLWGQKIDMSFAIVLLLIFLSLWIITLLLRWGKTLNIKVRERTIELEEGKKRLAEDKSKDEALLASIGDGCIAIDLKGKILFMNQSAARMLKIDHHQSVISKHYEAVWAVEDARGNRVSLDARPLHSALISSEKITADGLWYVRSDNTKFPVYITATPILRDGVVEGAIEIFQDITKDKEIEKLRVDFFSLASHQLRTPLLGTKWLIETVQRKVLGPLNAQQNDYLNKIYALNERMIKLVFDMLNVLRLESEAALVKKEKVSIPGVYDELLKTMESAAKNGGVALRPAFRNRGAVSVETDAVMVRTILDCFVSNAINYSMSGQEIVLDYEEKSGAVICFVKDEGIGIPKEEQKRIFEKFYRASNAKQMKPEGTGLGLYIVSMLAKKIGAEITFESEEGKGSTFNLQIPKNE